MGSIAKAFVGDVRSGACISTCRAGSRSACRGISSSNAFAYDPVGGSQALAALSYGGISRICEDVTLSLWSR